MTDGGGHDAGSIFIRLGLKTDDMLSGIGGISLAINQTLELFNKFLYYTSRFLALANQTANWAQEMEKLRKVTGLSYDSLQRFENVATQTQIDISSVTMAIRFMTNRMEDLQNPSSKAGKALREIGVSATDAAGNLKPMDTLIWEVIEGLQNIENPTVRNALAFQMMGRGAYQLAPILALTSTEMQKLKQNVSIFTESEMESMIDYGDKLDEINVRLKKLTHSIGHDLMPATKAWADLLIHVFSEETGTGKSIQQFASALGLIARVIDISLYALDAFQAYISGQTEKYRESLEKMDMARDEAVMRAEMGDAAYEKLMRTLEETGRAGAEAADGIEETGTAAEDAATKIRELETAYKEYNDLVMFGPGRAESEFIRAKYALEDAEKAFRDIDRLYKETMESGDKGIHYAYQIPEKWRTENPFDAQKETVAEYIQRYKDSIIRQWELAQADLTEAREKHLKAVIRKQELPGKIAAAWEEVGKREKDAAALLGLPSVDALKDTIETQTGILKDGFSEQGDAFSSLTTRMQEEGQKQIANFISLYTTLSEIVRTAWQKWMDDWKTTATAITAAVAYSQIITVRDGRMATTPISPSISMPTLTPIDLTGIAAAVAGSLKGTQTAGTPVATGGSAGNEISIEQNVTINNPQATPSQMKAVLRGTYRDLGKIVYSELH
jgi:hypothetical protein